MVPIPRGAIDNPAVSTGYPARLSKYGAINAELASITVAVQNTIDTPQTKLRSLNNPGGRNGRSAVNMCTTNRYSPNPASTASMMISRDENQSSVDPRSSISCSAPTPIASTANPVQSKRNSDRGVAFGRNTSSPITAS